MDMNNIDTAKVEKIQGYFPELLTQLMQIAGITDKTHHATYQISPLFKELFNPNITLENYTSHIKSLDWGVNFTEHHLKQYFSRAHEFYKSNDPSLLAKWLTDVDIPTAPNQIVERFEVAAEFFTKESEETKKIAPKENISKETQAFDEDIILKNQIHQLGAGITCWSVKYHEDEKQHVVNNIYDEHLLSVFDKVINSSGSYEDLKNILEQDQSSIFTMHKGRQATYVQASFSKAVEFYSENDISPLANYMKKSPELVMERLAQAEQCVDKVLSEAQKSLAEQRAAELENEVEKPNPKVEYEQAQVLCPIKKTPMSHRAYLGDKIRYMCNTNANSKDAVLKELASFALTEECGYHNFKKHEKNTTEMTVYENGNIASMLYNDLLVDKTTPMEVAKRLDQIKEKGYPMETVRENVHDETLHHIAGVLMHYDGLDYTNVTDPEKLQRYADGFFSGDISKAKRLGELVKDCYLLDKDRNSKTWGHRSITETENNKTQIAELKTMLDEMAQHSLKRFDLSHKIDDIITTVDSQLSNTEKWNTIQNQDGCPNNCLCCR